MAKSLWLAAVFLAVMAVVNAFPGPQPQGPAPVAPIRPQQQAQPEAAEKTDLKGENSAGLGYAYGGPWGGYGGFGGYGGWGYGGWGHGGGWGYGYPYGYALGYPYGGFGGFGGYGFYR